MAAPVPTLPLFNKPFDAQHQLQDDAAAITSSGNGTVGGSAVIRDLGEGVSLQVAVFDVNALDQGTGDETYVLKVEGSNSPTFASGIVTLGMQHLGGATAGAAVGPESAASSIATSKRFVVPFYNVKYGTVYRYVRARFVLSGTTPSLDAECYLTRLA